MSRGKKDDAGRPRICIDTADRDSFIPQATAVIAIRAASVSILVNSGTVAAASLFAYKRIAVSLSLLSLISFFAPHNQPFLLFFYLHNSRRRNYKFPHTCKNAGGGCGSFSGYVGWTCISHGLVCNSHIKCGRERCNRASRDNFRCLCLYYACVFVSFL